MFLLTLQLSTLRYDDWQFGFVVRASGNVFDFPHYQETIQDASENDVLVVEEVAFGASDEKLTAVGVFAAVGHRQESRSVMFEDKVLVVKCSAVNAVDTSAIALLNHAITKQLL